MRDITYLDEGGNVCNGYHWKVGIVIEPPNRQCTQSSITQATNTGMFSNRSWPTNSTPCSQS